MHRVATIVTSSAALSCFLCGVTQAERFHDLQKRIPERIIEKAVWGMLPKMRLGRQLFKHLYVYRGPEHPHGAQEPEDISGRYETPRPTAGALR